MLSERQEDSDITFVWKGRGAQLLCLPFAASASSLGAHMSGHSSASHSLWSEDCHPSACLSLSPFVPCTLCYDTEQMTGSFVRGWLSTWLLVQRVLAFYLFTHNCTALTARSTALSGPILFVFQSICLLNPTVTLRRAGRHVLCIFAHTSHGSLWRSDSKCNRRLDCTFSLQLRGSQGSIDSGPVTEN